MPRPYENPQGRRVNVLAALAAPGTHQHAPLTWHTAPHYWKGELVLAFLRQALPGRTGRPRIVVLDNAGIHHARKVRQARRALAERGIWLWCLPAYSPELNDIERTFRTLKHEAMPQRTFTATATLTAAVETRLPANQHTADAFRLSHAKCLGGTDGRPVCAHQGRGPLHQVNAWAQADRLVVQRSFHSVGTLYRGAG